MKLFRFRTANCYRKLRIEVSGRDGTCSLSNLFAVEFVRERTPCSLSSCKVTSESSQRSPTKLAAQTVQTPSRIAINANGRTVSAFQLIHVHQGPLGKLQHENCKLQHANCNTQIAKRQTAETPAPMAAGQDTAAGHKSKDDSQNIG